jgi:hypothetical protein
MLAEFQQRVEAKNAKGEYNNTTFHFISKKFEDYEHTYGHVDLILVVQSLYCISLPLSPLYFDFLPLYFDFLPLYFDFFVYMPNRREELSKAMKMGDELIFVLMSEKAGMHRTQIDLIPESQRSYKTVNSSGIKN